jgi:hypothetical protein
MELEELKLAWHSLDAKVDAAQRLQAATVRELKADRAESTLRPFIRLVYLELGLGIAAVLLLGAFLAGHWDVARYSVPAAVLHVVAILTVANAVSQLALIGQIDFSGPVVRAQGQLVKLTAKRAVAARWQLLLAPLLWTPFAIVVARGLLGFDIYRAFGWTWVNVNLMFGVAMIPVVHWVTRRFGERLKRSSIVRTMSDHIAGRSLDASMKALDEIASFERIQGK